MKRLLILCLLTACRPSKPVDPITPTTPRVDSRLSLWQSIGYAIRTNADAKLVRAENGTPEKVKDAVYIAPGATAEGVSNGRNATSAGRNATASGKKAGPTAGQDAQAIDGKNNAGAKDSAQLTAAKKVDNQAGQGATQTVTKPPLLAPFGTALGIAAGVVLVVLVVAHFKRNRNA